VADRSEERQLSENKHLNRPVTTWGAGRSRARLAVLAVHGRGQNPEFMYETSRRICTSGVRYYAPHANADTWYPKPFMEPIGDNEPDLTHGLDALQACIREIEHDGFTTSRTVLWGFSQGACLVSQLIVTRPMPVAGLMIFTGGWVGAEKLAAPPGRPLDGVPALLRSIDQDPWVPADRVRETAQVLGAMGASVDLHIAAGSDHIITGEATDTASRLLETIPGRIDPGP
jgi:predicted esterase